MRFTIRDLLWLTVLAAVLAAWWVDSERRSHVYQKIYAERQLLGLESQKWKETAQDYWELLRAHGWSGDFPPLDQRNTAPKNAAPTVILPSD